MPPATIDKLRAYLPTRTISADGQALPQYTVTAGSTSVFLNATLNVPAAGYLNGAIGWFDGNTSTTGLRGAFFHVQSSTTGQVILAKNLPAVPQVGDTFRLVLGGGYRSAQEAFGMSANG